MYICPKFWREWGRTKGLNFTGLRTETGQSSYMESWHLLVFFPLLLLVWDIFLYLNFVLISTVYFRKQYCKVRSCLLLKSCYFVLMFLIDLCSFPWKPISLLVNLHLVAVREYTVLQRQGDWPRAVWTKRNCYLNPEASEKWSTVMI